MMNLQISMPTKRRVDEGSSADATKGLDEPKVLDKVDVSGKCLSKTCHYSQTPQRKWRYILSHSQNHILG